MKNKVINNVLIAYMGLKISQMRKQYQKKQKKKPSCRVNPYLSQRNLKGRFKLDFEDMTRNEKIFNENFHMDVNSFEKLFNLLEVHLMPKRNVRRDAISPRQKLVVTLEYLASGSSIKFVASVYRISEQHLAPIIESVCTAICTVLMPSMSTLTKSDFTEVSQGFNNRWKFPNCLGAIDGKHVALITQPKSRRISHNYKDVNSIVLFAVADHNYKFIYLDIGAYSSEGDANIFSNSNFSKAVMGEELNFPDPKVINGEHLPHFFLGGDAFPLCRRIIKPYDGKNKLSEEEIIFNYRLSRARRCVENAFGILCIKWLCLKRTMFCSPDRAQKIITACCLLHNFLLEKSTAYCSPTLADTIDADGNINEGEIHQRVRNINDSSLVGSSLDTYRGRDCKAGKILRDKLKNYVNSSIGAVPWQRQATFLT